MAGICKACGATVETPLTCDVCGATVCREHKKEYGCALCQGRTTV